MAPDWKRLFEISSEDYWREADARNAEAREWGFPQSPEEFEKSPEGKLLLPEGVFWFVEAAQQNWCKHRTVRELLKFLVATNYPERFRTQKLITEAGYMKLVELQLAARRLADAKRKRNKRKKEKDEAR
jgi:hypothetical protein